MKVLLSNTQRGVFFGRNAVFIGLGGDLKRFHHHMEGRDTPPKTNMEPENGGPLEKEIPIGNHHFQVPC